jgi:Acetyltransferase (GNAT) domain
MYRLPAERPSLRVLRVVEVDPQADPRWEAFVAAHPDGLIYHHPAYLECLHREYDQMPVNLACEDTGGNIRGVLPLLHTRGLPLNIGGPSTRRRLSSLPRTPVAGLLALDHHGAVALMQTAVERCREKPEPRLELRMGSAELNGLLNGVVGMPFRSTYVLELPEHPEELRFGSSRNHGAVKRAVNKAARLGVQIRPAETERDLRRWYQLYLETFRWHAHRHALLPPRSYRFFKLCWEVLQPRGLMRLLLAERHEAGQSRLLAGSLFLMFGRTVFYACNGRRTEDLPLRPNDAIHWQAIHDAWHDGFRFYDLGEVPEDNAGLARFKSKWGAQPRWMYRYYYPTPPTVGPNIPEAGSYVRTLVKAAWLCLPLRATALLGDRLNSYL